MEKEGIKMETHQNWIKDSKKTQIKANQIRTGTEEGPVAAGIGVGVVVLCGG